MRLSWHVDEGVAVVSLWQGASCAGTFRLPISEVPTWSTRWYAGWR
jgi:hypothetical protein